MADHLRLTQEHAASMLSETIGALAFFLNRQELDARMQQYILIEPDLVPHESAITSSYRAFAVNGQTLGASMFLLPYERYKKELALYPLGGYNAGKTCGLNKYSSRRQFEEDYPGTDIVLWPHTAANLGQDWFANAVRNSFAHGQVYAVQRKQGEHRVEVSNSRDGLEPNFQIEMLLKDFWTMIADALDSFLTNAVEDDESEWTDPRLLALRSLVTRFRRTIENAEALTRLIQYDGRVGPAENFDWPHALNYWAKD